MDGKHIDKLQLAKFEADEMERRRQRRTVALKTLAFMAFWAAAVFAFWLGYTGKVADAEPAPTFEEVKAAVDEHVTKPTAYLMERHAKERNEMRRVKHEHDLAQLLAERKAAEVAKQATEADEEIAAEATESQPEAVYEPEPVAYAETYVEPVYAAYTPSDTPDAGNVDLRSAGVVYQDGTRFTWYSEKVLPGGGLTELNNNGRTVDERGFVVDGDGYIAVASSDVARGEVVSTPYGEGKVYDTGCASGTVDLYTSW